MTGKPMGRFLDFDWIESEHDFEEGPEEDNKRMSDERLTWHVCKQCGGRKLIKTSPADNSGPEARYIQMTIPDGMTLKCPDKE